LLGQSFVIFMAVSFSRTLQALQADRPVWRFVGLCFLFVIPLALGWLLYADITIYEVSSSARLESLPQTVAAEVEGKVVERLLQIGLEVEKGQVLVRLDDQHILNLIAESTNQIDAAERHIKALQSEIVAKEASFTSLAVTRELAIKSAKEKLDSASIEARLAQQKFSRIESLAKARAIAEEDVDEKRAGAETAQGNLRNLELNVALVAQDYTTREFNLKSELLTIRTELVKAEGDLANSIKQLQTRKDELKQRTLVSNVAGRVEEVVPLRIGNVVKPAEKLATIVPRETPRVVAFVPVIAVGRVATRQKARLRMDGFPWTQYGTVSAIVTAVGNEPTDGFIRVELDIMRDIYTPIPLIHGQTASVEIAVDRASPARLILRAAGEFLTTHRPAQNRQ
jgi:multidrug resistance efflux pump